MGQNKGEVIYASIGRRENIEYVLFLFVCQDKAHQKVELGNRRACVPGGQVHRQQSISVTGEKYVAL